MHIFLYYAPGLFIDAIHICDDRRHYAPAYSGALNNAAIRQTVCPSLNFDTWLWRYSDDIKYGSGMMYITPLSRTLASCCLPILNA